MNTFDALKEMLIAHGDFAGWRYLFCPSSGNWTLGARAVKALRKSTLSPSLLHRAHHPLEGFDVSSLDFTFRIGL
jgi:hypothetical protein